MASDIYPGEGLKDWEESLYSLIEPQCRECPLPGSFICQAVAKAYKAAKAMPLEEKYRVMERAQDEIIAEFGEGRLDPCAGLQPAYYSSPDAQNMTCRSAPVAPVSLDALL